MDDLMHALSLLRVALEDRRVEFPIKMTVSDKSWHTIKKGVLLDARLHEHLMDRTISPTDLNPLDKKGEPIEGMFALFGFQIERQAEETRRVAEEVKAHIRLIEQRMRKHPFV